MGAIEIIMVEKHATQRLYQKKKSRNEKRIMVEEE